MTPASGSSRTPRNTTARNSSTKPTPKPHETDEAPVPGKRATRTINIDAELVERMRAAVQWLGSYEPEAGVNSMGDLVEMAVPQILDKLEKKYGPNGGPFPRVAVGGVKRGRR